MSYQYELLLLVHDPEDGSIVRIEKGETVSQFVANCLVNSVESVAPQVVNRAYAPSIIYLSHMDTELPVQQWALRVTEVNDV